MAYRRYWFPAKRYGWGWGLPCAWQGWVVMIAFFALFYAGFALLLPRHAVAFVLYTFGITLVLIAICWVKGEPPRWRWG